MAGRTYPKAFHIILHQKGVSIIAIIAVMLILSVMGIVLISLVTTGSNISVNQLQSEQALHVAEGGKEYILANRIFPNYSTQGTPGTPIPLGAGNLTVATPAYLTAPVAIGDTTVTVNSTSSFPASGKIVIDYEVMTYTATTATTFTLAAGTSVSVPHTNGNAVYPVTTVTDNPLGSGASTINVSSSTGFVTPGVIKIESEYLYCAGSTATTFTACTRGYKETTAAAHAVGSTVFQYIVTSTGTVGNTQRIIRTSIDGAVGGNGLSIKQGWFQKRNGVGAQSILGVGFQPKAVVFFWTRQTVAGFATPQSMGFGFTTGPANERSVAIAENDNANNSTAGRRKSVSNMIILLSNGNPTLAAQAGLTSFDADGFTINWTTNDARADIIYYLAIGGDDITNALASTFTSDTLLAANQAVTGLGFQPDFVMFLSGFTGNNDVNLNNSQLSIGFAKNSSAQGAIVTGSLDNSNPNDFKQSQQRTNACILLFLDDITAQDAVANFVSMDADGFTINWSDPPASLATPIFYLALKGGRYQVDDFNQATAIGNQSVNDVGFQPTGLMMASFNKTAQAPPVAPNALSIGAAQSSTARGSIWGEATMVPPTRSDANSYTNTGYALTMASGPVTINAQADFVGFDIDGFILNWTTADATARQILYWAIGPNAAASNNRLTQQEVY